MYRRPGASISQIVYYRRVRIESKPQTMAGGVIFVLIVIYSIISPGSIYLRVRSLSVSAQNGYISNSNIMRIYGYVLSVFNGRRERRHLICITKRGIITTVYFIGSSTYA